MRRVTQQRRYGALKTRFFVAARFAGSAKSFNLVSENLIFPEVRDYLRNFWCSPGLRVNVVLRIRIVTILAC